MATMSEDDVSAESEWYVAPCTGPLVALRRHFDDWVRGLDVSRRARPSPRRCGHDAGLADGDIERRGVPLAFQYAAIQLCDDLSDGDCDYLHAPARTVGAGGAPGDARDRDPLA